MSREREIAALDRAKNLLNDCLEMMSDPNAPDLAYRMGYTRRSITAALEELCSIGLDDGAARSRVLHSKKVNRR